MTQRAYDNSSRALKRLQTREAIVQTMVSLMADGRDDVSVADVARLSGVSLRTVYQHFPDKAARVEGINDWIEGQVDMSAVLPQNFGDIPPYVDRMVDYILQNETIIRAQMSSGLAKEVRNYRKRAHRQKLRKALGDVLGDKKQVDQLAALIICTVRAETVFDLRDLYRLPVPEIKANLRRMIELMLAQSRAD